MMPVAPDRRALEAHLKGARFQMGIDGGLWRVIESGWPHMLIAVTAAPRENAPAEFALRFELSGYPQSAPTAAVWASSITGSKAGAAFSTPRPASAATCRRSRSIPIRRLA